jgi:hypothetical protein
MNIHRLTAEEALANLHSRLGGLDLEEVARRLLEFGPNQVESLPLACDRASG